jgi:hypothetical protein
MNNVHATVVSAAVVVGAFKMMRWTSSMQRHVTQRCSGMRRVSEEYNRGILPTAK